MHNVMIGVTVFMIFFVSFLAYDLLSILYFTVVNSDLGLMRSVSPSNASRRCKMIVFKIKIASILTAHVLNKVLSKLGCDVVILFHYFSINSLSCSLLTSQFKNIHPEDNGGKSSELNVYQIEKHKFKYIT